MTTALVLGAATRPDGTASPALTRRALHAAELYRRGRVSRILCSGGVNPHAPAEATLIAGICRANGVPEAALILDDRATSTRDNVANARAILANTPVVLVTDGWHMPRALLTARRLGLAAAPEPVPGRHGTWTSRLRELPALAWYALTVWR